MKKLPFLSFLFLSLFLIAGFFPSPVKAACDPPHDYSDCPELRPDLNINLLNPVPITGNLGLNDFWGGETDVKAPQLSTLINGNPNPSVTSLYQLHYWDWQNNQVGPSVPPPSNLDLNRYDFATLVGFSTQPGQSILVPNSGYDIGQGNEVMVLFATENSITLKYTGDDNVFVGYTFYLNNFQVDPQLLAYYNELNAAGRKELPVLKAGMQLGIADANEILVAIRDTGSFMDPRWFWAWWFAGLDPAMLELLLAAFPAGQGFQPPVFACNVNNPGDPDSRPVPCDACNQTDLLTPSCATAFTVNDYITYLRGDADFFCPGEEPKDAWVERSWGGIVTIDPSDTTIPFVGKKGMEDEKKYLADYFEGTGFYYSSPYDFSNAAEMRRLLMESGVWRKLAPLKVQDEYKKAMVDRAIRSATGGLEENVIHDYLIEYNGESALLSEFKGHYPPEDLQERVDWAKNTKWGRLWAAVPMFSREDTVGYIYPYLGAKPDDNFEIMNPNAQIEKVPHLARLYEISQALNKLLNSVKEEASQTQANLGTTIASAQEKVLGEKTDPGLIIAQAAPDFPYGCKWYYSTNEKDPTDCSCMASGTCRGEHGGCCPPHGFWGVCGWDDCQPQVRCPNPPDNGCPAAWIVGGPLTPEGHECNFRDPLPVDACVRESISDTNPNDDLCCSPISILLTGTDRFPNPEYEKCQQEPSTCRLIAGCVPTPDNDCITCQDPCDETVTREVSRQVGVQLVHPYLQQIWEYSTENLQGFFNHFRPSQTTEFEELDAHSSLFYDYSSGSVTPPGGYFYFPYLGGIQKAKEWVVQALNPSSGGTAGQSGKPAPGLISPLEPVTLNYTIDYRNPNVTISAEAKAEAIRIALNSWPNSKLESHWDYVHDRAVAAGWNPAFVIALWIEESGASGLYTYDVGCLGASRGDLVGQLDCLFARPYANTSFEEFMCTYSEGHYPCEFTLNPNFPGNLKEWYDRLTQ